MTDLQLAEMLILNEPYFMYNGIEYSICSPDGKIFCVSSENDPPDADLTFATVEDLLNGWIIHGKPFREILSQTDLI